MAENVTVLMNRFEEELQGRWPSARARVDTTRGRRVAFASFVGMQRCLLGILVAGGLAAGCTGMPVKSDSTGIGGGMDEVESLDDATQARVDDGLSALANGELDRAQETFASVLATQPDGAAGQRASLYLAVIELRRGQPDEAVSRLELLRDGERGELERAVSNAVEIYLCLAKRTRDPDDEDPIAELAANYLGDRPSPLVDRADQALGMMMLARAREREHDTTSSLAALSWAFELGQRHHRDYAIAAALTQTRGADPTILGQLVTDATDDFLIGTAGAGLVLGLRDRNEALPEDLAQHVPRIETSLVRLGAPDLATEVVAAAGGRTEAPALRMGVLLPLSGSDRRVGQRALGGVLLAQRAFRSGGGAVTIVVEDTRSTTRGAADGVAALADKGVSAIVGPLSDGEARAAGKAAQERGIPLIATCFDADVPSLGDFVFRLFFDAEREVELLVLAARQAGASSLAVVYPDRPFGRSILAIAKKVAGQYGIDVVLTHPYDPTKTRDFSKAAREVRRAKAEAVFIPDTAGRVSQLLPFLAAEELWCSDSVASATADAEGRARRAITCLGPVTWDSPALLRDDYARDAYVAASWTAVANHRDNRQFVRDHEQLLGRPPDLFSAYTYEGARLVDQLLVAGASDPNALRAALAALDKRQGLVSPLKTNPDGDIIGEPLLLRVGPRGLHPVER